MEMDINEKDCTNEFTKKINAHYVNKVSCFP